MEAETKKYEHQGREFIITPFRDGQSGSVTMVGFDVAHVVITTEHSSPINYILLEIVYKGFIYARGRSTPEAVVNEACGALIEREKVYLANPHPPSVDDLRQEFNKVVDNLPNG